LFLVAPYALGFHLDISAHELAIIRAWQLLPAHVPPGPVWLLPLSSFFRVGVRLGVVFSSWSVLGGILLWRFRDDIDRSDVFGDLLFVGSILLLVLNAFVWILPASPALYPDRIMLLMVLPASNLLAEAFEATRRRLAGSTRSRLAVGCAGLAIS